MYVLCSCIDCNLGSLIPYEKITLNPHVAHMWPTCVHMCPTCVVPISHVYPHVVKFFHMWNTCEVGQTHVNIMCLTCYTHEPTCDYMWGLCGLLSLSITLTCGKIMWNWNNTQNPHVNFMWFFRGGITVSLVLWIVRFHVPASLWLSKWNNKWIFKNLKLVTS